MGFFDFLHGVTNQKSEAELYMEQRNKEYARRAAAYKRKEAMSMTFGGGGVLEKLFTHNDTTKRNTVRANNYNNGYPRNAYQTPNHTKLAQPCVPTSQSYIKQNCDSCGTSQSIYDSGNLDIFTVENAFVRPTTRTVTASGNVIRGGFSVGDKVVVKTTLEERVVSIQQIFRQGESIDYANMSSGKIAIVLSNAADIMVRKGDQITKKK